MEEPAAPSPFFREARARYARLCEEVLGPRQLASLRRWLAQGPAEVARWGPLPEAALCVEDAPAAPEAGGGGAGGAPTAPEAGGGGGGAAPGAWGAPAAEGAGAWGAPAAEGAGAWDAPGAEAAAGDEAENAAWDAVAEEVAEAAGWEAALDRVAVWDSTQHYERKNRAKAIAIALTAWQGLLRGIGLARGRRRAPPAVALARELLRHPWLARRASALSRAALAAIARMPGGFALAVHTPRLLRHWFRTGRYTSVHLPGLLTVVDAVAANGDHRDARGVLAHLGASNALPWMGPADFAAGARNPRRAVFEFFAGAALDALGAKGEPRLLRRDFPGSWRARSSPQAWLDAAGALGGARVEAVRAMLAAREALFARWAPASEE